MKTRVVASAVAASLALSLGLAGCGTNGSGPTNSSAPAGDKTFTIGVTVIVTHPSLQAIEKGFKDVLSEKGVKVTYKEENAAGDLNVAGTIATTFAKDSSLDLILAIATPTAVAMVQQENAAPTDQRRPILYAGVTDPAGVGLVPSNEGPSGTNVTGASDLNPNAKPVAMIQSMVPAVKTIGVLYSSSESNSQIQIDAFKKEAAPLGITIKPTAITNSSEIATAVETMTDVDAILIPTDNTVVAGVAPVIAFGERAKIPVFTADADTLKKGAVASRGVNYETEGREVGQMAYDILVNGKAVGEVPAIVSQQTQLFVNPGAAEKMGVTIPAAVLADAEQVATTG